MVVDIVAALVMLLSTVIGILRGFIREVLTIFGIVGGALASYIGGPLAAPIIKGWLGITEGQETPDMFLGVVPYPLLGDVLAYGTVFIVFVILLSVLSHFLAESVKNMGLGAVDRTLGMVFGFLRGVLFLGLLYLPIYYLAEDNSNENGTESEWAFLEDSKSRVYLQEISGWLAGFIPVEPVDETPENSEGNDLGNTIKNEARKKLEEMDLLPNKENTEQPTQNGADGYSEDFRNKMDSLIEDATSGAIEDKSVNE